MLSFKFPGSRFNRGVTAMAMLVAALFCWHSWDNPGAIFAHFRKAVADGLTFATSILGFLVAGFTVFATITKIEIFVSMARIEYENTRESYLKYNLNAFVLAFVHYIALVFFCIVAQLFGQTNGVLALVLHKLTSIYPTSEQTIRAATASALFTFFAAWMVYLLVLLKSFIYNTYQVLTTAVRLELQQGQDAEQSAKGSSEQP
ncbi:hypothetical protein HLB44_18490 [Aquincola sp. S2]|uniref:Uncharacterized protein n=1 Tax=Pseudaquabacterium terrae TaxID=2732868 RepID=A0ABX2EK57_9BURK|nr:hypothetical protein [Aquabacterium terrae]NRF68986.1 hypothetical protein [Aquabacterium terrae]